LPGGGGYGNAAERDPALLTRDREEGYVTDSASRDQPASSSPK
jgi:N-methylhydantoinase B/oxoprolinase/acetone carboxylase alpha subunit